jgi:pyruvate oxidase
VLGDVTVAVSALLDALDGDHAAATAGLDVRAEVAARWAIWRDEKARRTLDDATHGIGSAAVMDALTRRVAHDAVIAVDVGNNTYSFGRYFEAWGEQELVMSGYLGSIGFALPAAMGAWAAYGNGRQIVAVSGDGGLGQDAMESTTAVKYGMDITHVVLDNSELGKISKEQRAAHHAVWQTSLHNPDFAAFAELCGARGFRVTDPADLDDAIAAALAHPGPALVDIITDPQLV